MSLKKTYEALHEATVKELLKRVKSGTATAADLGVARQLLRDNGIDIGSDKQKRPMLQLAEKLPFETEEEQAANG
jgi:hypothetical protein